MYFFTEILHTKKCVNHWLWKQDSTDVVVEFVSKSPKHWTVFQQHSGDCHGDWSAFLSLERMHMQRAVRHRWAQFNITNNAFVLRVLLQMIPFVAGQNNHLHHKWEYSHTDTHLILIICSLLRPLLLCSHSSQSNIYPYREGSQVFLLFYIYSATMRRHTMNERVHSTWLTLKW